MSFDRDLGGFEKSMISYMDARKITCQKVLVDQAQKLVSSDFNDGGVKRGGLYQEARKEAPKTIAEIKSLPARLGYRIKRRKGMTVAMEIKRRLKNAGYVQSTGWLNRVWKIKGVKWKQVGRPRNRVIQNLNGLNPSIEIINETPGAAEFAEKTGYFDRAVANREQDMANYCEKKMLEAAKKSGFKVA